MTSPQELIEVAQGQIGFVESDNNYTPYGKWYKLNNNPYSAMFVSWCFAKIGKSELIAASSERGFASPQIGYEWFKKRNQLIETSKAKPGDIVFLAFYEPIHGRVNHVGIVKEVSYLQRTIFKVPVALVTIEANVSGELGRSSTVESQDGVYQRTRALGKHGGIVAVARPTWD